MRLIMVFIILLLVSCSAGENQEEPHPYSHIPPSFSYSGFQFPEQWETVSAAKHVQPSYRDEESGETRFGDMPYRMEFIFGAEAEENEVTEIDLQAHNELQEAGERTRRLLYYHTYHSHYADFRMNRNGFQVVLQEYEETEEWEVDGVDVLVYEQQHQWAADWVRGGTYYELIVYQEAHVETAEQFENVLSLFLQDP
ncbi:hypothetical protein [Alkalicoccus chagannorensis]|uniref:hypothetical protein n=1 Tax=Alkalicoccus chagannorensis TaxID=427072 RepID=UPI000409B905|nr:hypothetical protein [Alkalicoccus chagannorensis]